jgi:O-acetyl-ADP-ribose deacetylase (regulator of RNase III)
VRHPNIALGCCTLSIATPLLGTGVVGLEKEKVKEIIKNLSEKFPNLEIIIVEK